MQERSNLVDLRHTSPQRLCPRGLTRCRSAASGVHDRVDTARLFDAARRLQAVGQAARSKHRSRTDVECHSCPPAASHIFTNSGENQAGFILTYLRSTELLVM